ncbi:MAG: hypothetical protein Q4B79_00210 [Moraxella sp.]|uniref:hypothetical protein n=1 Tax=Moraxella sp. TaxID=479 RepID=UPI0026DCD35E|nr:hypothetical protein [Moraxella sp.]MDO4449368.1 hypothetical protein [Moraxella sp.]
MMIHPKYTAGRTLVMILSAITSYAHANLETDPNHHTWIDHTHEHTKKWLNRTAHTMDDWFGQTDPNNPARASIRVMLDTHYSADDGTTIKPRIRARVRLPTLEHRLSVIVGDDDLDLEHGGGIYNDGRIVDSQETFNHRQARKDNSSLALRWSKFQETLGVDTDADIGLRSDDIYLKLRAEKRWELDHDIDGRFEQVYRYGSKSEHFALSTLEFSQPQSNHRTLINRTHLAYTHKDDENTAWSNSLYQRHQLNGKHGMREFSYGMYAGGDFTHKTPTLNTYGPYISYRQPIWRDWLFIQTDVSYYNNKSLDKNHDFGIFNRLEIQF